MRTGAALSTLGDLGTEFFSFNLTSMAKDCILRVLVRAAPHVGGTSLIGALVAALVIAASPTASALMVGTTPNVIPDTSWNPGDTSPPPNGPSDGSHLAQGDPGWGNAAHTFPYFYNGVYIGNGWMLTANHANFSSATFTDGGTVYNAIPGQSYQVLNPTGVPGLTDTYADLRLYRIDADPGLPSLTIASQPLAVTDTVAFVATGLLRSSTETHWNVSNGTWTTVPSGGTNSGYLPNQGGKRWGTNTVENADKVLTGTNGSVTTNVNNGTIANLTTFDRSSSNPYEAQVVAGDSGSPVFHYNTTTSHWELTGIVLATYVYTGQDSTWAVYGDASAFADLSSYRSNILSIMSAHQDYSVAGDLDLDGVPGTASDIAAFVNGWGSNNHTGQGTIASWKLGDLNRDGKTDFADFLKFRSGLSPGAGAALDSMMGGLISSGVPEPSTMFLAIGSAILFALCGRKRRSRPGSV